MMRKLSFLVVVVTFSLLLAGCGNNPDTLFKKGDYAGAYPEFVKRGGLNESSLKNEVVNGSFNSRNNAGNQAIHDFYYAAECQKRLGNNAEAQMYYQKVVALSQYQIRIPSNQGDLVKNAFDSYMQAVRNFRDREVQLSSTNSSPTDPYSTGGSSTDPYSGGSNTDPYSGGSNTDPYDNGNSGSYSVDSTYQMYYNTMISRRREFERLLYGVTSAQMPEIQSLQREYDYVSRGMDSYLRVVAYGGVLQRPNANYSRILYNSFADDATRYQRSLYSAQTNMTYTNYSLKLSEPNLVTQAQIAIGSSASAPSEPTTSSGDTSASTPTTSSPVTGTSQDLVSAEREMTEAYQNYQKLINSGKASAVEIRLAAEKYQDARKRFDSAKNR